MRYDCVHLEIATTQSVEERCGEGMSMRHTQVWTCGVHGLCTPFATGPLTESDGPTNCLECPDYERSGMYCELTLLSGDTYQCIRCGAIFTTTYSGRVQNECYAQPLVSDTSRVESSTPSPENKRSLLGSVSRLFLH